MPYHTYCPCCFLLFTKERARGIYCSITCRNKHFPERQDAFTRFSQHIQYCIHGPSCFYCCHEWQAGRIRKGYGHWTRYNKAFKTHRLAWEFHHSRPLPSGSFCCHWCNNPPCCNPQHLYAGSCLDNLRQASRESRMSHGEQHFHSKLTEEDIIRIRSVVQPGRSPFNTTRLAKMYGVTEPLIRYIVQRKIWKHIP